MFYYCVLALTLFALILGQDYDISLVAEEEEVYDINVLTQTDNADVVESPPSKGNGRFSSLEAFQQAAPRPAEVCLPSSGEFYNMPERLSAMSTGSISSSAFRLSQDYRELCLDFSSKKFRTIDGSCNNLRNWGTSFKPVSRILPARYQDGVGSPRTKASDGTPLPGARFVSLAVHPAVTDLTSRPIIAMQWGQWIDHDITGFPAATSPNGPLVCCGPNNTSPPANTDPNCFPILLPASEEDFVGTCMSFVRSNAATDANGCQLKPRRQVNSVTPFLDASQVYGSTDAVAASVRDAGDFLLKTKNEKFLPENVNSSCIRRPGTNDYCFLAGDFRVNQHPYLQSLHTVFLRDHNRIARKLRALRPNDSNENIFQLSRKIIGALQQMITYNEWLPVILGQTAKKLGLVSKTGRTKFQSRVDPRILVEFSSAAMRFGHSLIPAEFPIGDRRVPLRQLFNRPGDVLDNLDDVTAGMVGVGTPGKRNTQKVDRNFVVEITKHLFEPPTAPKRGLDLVSFNIQRGRDHGIAPYTTYRALCGLRPVRGFKDVKALGPNVADLAKIYKSVNDIDLFTGLVHEPVLPGSNGLVGPTLACILGTQFYNLKFGDRFFFDTDDKSVGFTDKQLQSLRKVTLAKVICANTDITALPKDVFNFPSRSNPLIPCDRHEGLDLSLFA
ncbi:unnamed protein product [Lymnaea stagnalis]|uniref:Peroxidase n=1 Tax=Lymnaea stagnalis TaxID=6523 RepID=A0AAV2H8U0_LYMST